MFDPAVQFDLHGRASLQGERADDDAVDELAHRGDHRLVEVAGVSARRGQVCLQLLDHLGIGLGDPGVQVDGGALRFDRGALGGQRVPLRFHLGDLDREGRRGRAVEDRLDASRDPAFQFAQPRGDRAKSRAAIGFAPGEGGVIGADIGADGRRLEHALAKGVEHELLDFALHDAAAVGAGDFALLAARRADQAALVGRGVAAAAIGALDQAAEQRGLTLDELMGPVLGALGLAATSRLPNNLVDDAQVLNRGALPLAARAQVFDACAGARILAELGPVPHLHPGIELGLQDAVAALARAVDGRGVPHAAARPGLALAVQLLGDGAGSQAADKAVEDAANDLGLRLDDLHRAAGVGLVTIDRAACGEAALGVGADAALGLGAEVAQVVLGDQTLERDVHRLDAIGRKRGQLGAGIVETVHDVREVLQAPRNAVFVLAQQHVELAALGGGQGGE